MPLIIENNEVKLNTPNNFNDPYDTKLLLNKDDLNKATDLLLNYILEEQFKKVVLDKNIKIQWWLRPTLFFARLTFRLQNYSNNRLKEYRPAMNFSRLIRMFHSLGLKNGNKDSESQKALENFVNEISGSDMKNYLENNINKSTQELLITSFSKNPLSILMWSHYADNSRGVCLEFENEDFLDVVYSKKRKKFDINKLLYNILWNYQSDIGEFDAALDATNLITQITPFLTKSSDWSYEYEVRAIFNDKNPNIIKNDKGYFYKMKNLISITLGYRVSEEKLEEVTKFAKQNKIKLYKMELSEKTYDLVRKEV